MPSTFAASDGGRIEAASTHQRRRRTTVNLSPKTPATIRRKLLRCGDLSTQCLSVPPPFLVEFQVRAGGARLCQERRRSCPSHCCAPCLPQPPWQRKPTRPG